MADADFGRLRKVPDSGRLGCSFWKGFVEGHDFSRAASRPKPGRLQPPGFTVFISPFIFLQSGYF
jgi:hypothetical protein